MHAIGPQGAAVQAANLLPPLLLQTQPHLLAPSFTPRTCLTHIPTAADVPGLLEGAHAGVGLGHQFLRHCQRCRVLVHVVDGTSPDPMGDYRAIRQELELFNPDLAAKPQVGPDICGA